MAVASSHPPERANLRVAMKLLRVSRSFETRTRVKGIHQSANARSRHGQEEFSSNSADTNTFPLLASNAKRSVERCLSWQPSRCTLGDAQGLRRAGCARRPFRSKPHCRDGRQRCRQKGWCHCNVTRMNKAYFELLFAPPLETGSRHGPLGALHTSSDGDAVALKVHQRQYGLSELAQISTDDALFLDTKTEASVGHLDLKQLSRNLAYVNDALAVLHLVRHEETSTSSQLYDETTAANLEHLLLRVQHSLVEAFIGRLAKIVVANASAWYGEWKQKGKLGGQQWCSEFSSNRRPQSTTWPWTIRPALAVLWGVCWMFYDSGDNYSGQRGAASSDRERNNGAESSQHGHVVPPTHVLSDPDNAQFFKSLGGENGAYLAYGQQALGLADFEPFFTAAPGGEESRGAGSDEAAGGGSGVEGSDACSGGAAEAEAEAAALGGAFPDLLRLGEARVSTNSCSQPTAGITETARPPTFSPLARRRQYDAHQYITSSNADSLFSPSQHSAAAFVPKASLGDARQPQALGLSIDDGSWHAPHNSQHFQPFLATHPVSPHAAHPDHLIPTITVTASALRRPLPSVTGNKAAAPQAYNSHYYPTTTYATSSARPESLQNSLNAFDVPNSSQHDASSLFSTSPPFFSSQPDLMGLQVMTSTMYQHDQIRTEPPSTSDEPPSKRRRVSNASQAHSVASTHMLDEHERSTSPAASDSISPQGFPLRRGYTFKRNGDPPRNPDGKIICQANPNCKALTFDRKCEWGKHMDKHERPYRCDRAECSKLQGFTYSGGLLRHQREVHNMHGGTGKRLFCPEASCKRAGGSGFTRKENLNEHMRRVHRRTDSVSEASTNAGGAAKTDDDAEARSSVDRNSPRSRASTAFNDNKRAAIFVKPEKPAEDDDAPDSELLILRRALTSRDEELAQTRAQLKEQGERLKRLEEMMMRKSGFGID